jgi:hypothetical protein
MRRSDWRPRGNHENCSRQKSRQLSITIRVSLSVTEMRCGADDLGHS